MSTVAVKAINFAIKRMVYLKLLQAKIIKGDLEKNAVATPGVFMISPNE